MLGKYVVASGKSIITYFAPRFAIILLAETSSWGSEEEGYRRTNTRRVVIRYPVCNTGDPVARFSSADDTVGGWRGFIWLSGGRCFMQLIIVIGVSKRLWSVCLQPQKRVVPIIIYNARPCRDSSRWSDIWTKYHGNNDYYCQSHLYPPPDGRSSWL